MTARTSEGDVAVHGVTQKRMALLAGPAMAITFVGGTILAAITLPSIQWTETPLGELGVILYLTVIVGSLLGLLFLRPVWLDASHTIQRIGVGLFALALAMMVGVNAFEAVFTPIPAPAEVLGLGYLLVLPVAYLVHGLGDVVAGNRRRGGITLTLWVGYFLSWFYSFQSREVTVLIGFLWLVFVSAWAVVQYVSLSD